MEKAVKMKTFCGSPNVVETSANEWLEGEGVEIHTITQSSWGDGIALTIAYYYNK